MNVTQHPQSHCLETWTCISAQLKWCNFPSSHPHCWSNWLRRMADNWAIFLSTHSLCIQAHAHAHTHTHTHIQHASKLWCNCKMRFDWPTSNMAGNITTTAWKKWPYSDIPSVFCLMKLSLSAQSQLLTNTLTCLVFLKSYQGRSMSFALSWSFCFHCPLHPSRHWPIRPWCSFSVSIPPSNLITRCQQPIHTSLTLTWSTCGRVPAR